MDSPLHPLQFSHHLDEARDKHVLQATSAAGEPVGYMEWHHAKTVPDKLRGTELSHTVADINVPKHSESGEPLRHRGIARGMWEHAQTLEHPPAHSPSRTPEGDRFAKAVGGYRPMTAAQLALVTVGLADKRSKMRE